MLADKENLERWIAEGKKHKRADAPDVEVMLNSFSESILQDTTMQRHQIDLGHRKINGVTFNLYQPWYKSSPVGMIHDIGVVLDGEKIPREDIQLILKGGQRVMLYNARTIQDIWWNIVDPIRVFMAGEDLAPGAHELEVTVAEEISAYYEFPLNMLMGVKRATMQLAS